MLGGVPPFLLVLDSETQAFESFQSSRCLQKIQLGGYRDLGLAFDVVPERLEAGCLGLFQHDQVPVRARAGPPTGFSDRIFCHSHGLQSREVDRANQMIVGSGADWPGRTARFGIERQLGDRLADLCANRVRRRAWPRCRSRSTRSAHCAEIAFGSMAEGIGLSS